MPPAALTKFGEWMWSGKGKLSRRVGGCPDDRGTIYPPPFFPVVPRTPKLTRSSVAGCRMTPYLTTRSVGSEGSQLGSDSVSLICSNTPRGEAGIGENT